MASQDETLGASTPPESIPVLVSPMVSQDKTLGAASPPKSIPILVSPMASQDETQGAATPQINSHPNSTDGSRRRNPSRHARPRPNMRQARMRSHAVLAPISTMDSGKKLEPGETSQKPGEKSQELDGEKQEYKPKKQHESRRKSAAPPQPLRRNPPRKAPVAIATASAPSATVRKRRPKPGKKEQGEEEEEEEFELEIPPEPKILPLLPFMAKLGPGQGLGCEAAVGSLVPTRKQEFKSCGKHTEGKRPLYAIGFNFMDARYYDVFATVGGNRVTTYRCLDDGRFALLQAYIDEDKDESFYTLSWARDHVDDSPLLVAAGSNGIIRVINCATEKIAKSFVGHGDSINEIRTQALKPSLIISASKDESVRLWNVHTGICILIFAGAGGHRNEVLSVDFHPSDIYRFASCGMDNTVRIWSMKEFWPYVDKSYSWTDLPSKFPTKYVQFPVLIASVHSNYVDCTRWLGDFILSKSVDNEIVLWEPKTKEQSPGEGTIDILQKYPVPECDIWFIKFSCDFHFNQLAIGNREGKIYVWEVQSSPPNLIARLTNPQCKSPIRQTAVSFDGSTILGAGEDGTIWRWDAVDPSSGKH